MSAPLAVFRCDASPEIGGGHVARCRALAAAMATLGWRSVFAGAAGREALPMHGDARAQAVQLRARIPDGTALLVVDSYGLDAAFETACRGWARRILVIDDLADRRHDCDVLLDAGADADGARYRALVGDDARLLLGPGFAPLRAEFQQARCAALRHRSDAAAPPRRILVSFGSTDPRDATRHVLEALLPLRSEIEIDVAIGSAAPGLPRLRESFGREVALHVDASDMAGLMAQADLGIGASGATSWERCCLGLPAVLATLAENQRPNARALATRGAAVDLGDVGACATQSLRDAVGRLLRDGAARRAMSAAASRLCDGRGIQRTLVAMLGERRLRDGRRVRLALAEPKDSATMLDWQQRPGLRRYTRNPAPPTATEHAAWFDATLCRPERILTMIRVDGRPAGMLRLDRREAEASWEISILVAPEFQGMGVGGAALALARELAPGVPLDAAIHPENVASRAMFARAGYAATGDDWYRSLP
jgi:UDP-2,4-diacetamido-2,4,6-trideoxy-beta-L-altropyranose hydrolase